MEQHKTIRFDHTTGTEFYNTLRNRINSYFTDNKIEKTGNLKMHVKTVILLSAFILPLLTVYFLQLNPLTVILCYALMGVAMAGVGMSVMHDAGHNAYSGNTKVNKIIGFSINLVGGMMYNWKLQHNVLHHTFTNITGHDEDIDSKLIIRLSPLDKRYWFHRFQKVYAFVFYAILTLYWVVAKDFVQYFKYTRNGVNRTPEDQLTTVIIKTIVVKIAHIFFFIALPIYIIGAAWPIVVGFLIMHALAGLILSIIFQLAHVVTETEYPMPNEDGMVENAWAIHQLETTMNFAPKNKLITWYVGGLNFQVEHHLFPNICHVHYSNIAPIVRQTARDFGIPYHEKKTFMAAFISHLKMLDRLGKTDPMPVEVKIAA